MEVVAFFPKKIFKGMVICKALVNTSWKTDDLRKAYDLHIISPAKDYSKT